MINARVRISQNFGSIRLTTIKSETKTSWKTAGGILLLKNSCGLRGAGGHYRIITEEEFIKGVNEIKNKKAFSRLFDDLNELRELRNDQINDIRKIIGIKDDPR